MKAKAISAVLTTEKKEKKELFLEGIIEAIPRKMALYLRREEVFSKDLLTNRCQLSEPVVPVENQ